MTDSAIQLEKTKKYDMPLSKLDHDYISKCDDAKELEKIIKILRSGEEGHYPDMEQLALDRLEAINPKSRILRKDNPVVKSKDLAKDEKKELEEDMQEFLTSIKSKEVGSGDSDQLENASLPPIRKGQINMTTKQQESKTQRGNSSSKKSAMPRSYKEWDKIDIDKELEEADKEDIKRERHQNGSALGNKKIPDIPLEVDTTGLSNEERNLRADREKDKGNEAFRCGDYEESIIYFSRSLSVLETPNTYNNRALAYIKLSKWEKAIEDCDEVLDEEPQNIKGLLRRGVSYIALEDYDSAERDFNDVLLHYPNNKLAYEKLKVCENARKELEKKKMEKKVKGRRMVIEETDGSDDQVEEQSNNETKTLSKEQAKKGDIPQHKQNGHDDFIDSIDRSAIRDVKTKATKTPVTDAKKPVQPKKEKVKDIWSLDEIENFVNVNTDANLEAMSMGVSNPTTLPERPAKIQELDSDENDEEAEEMEVEKPTPLTITEITEEDEQQYQNTPSIAEETTNTNQEKLAENEARSESIPVKQKSPSPEILESTQTGEKMKDRSEPAQSVPVDTKAEGACSNRTVYRQEKLPPRLVSVKEEGSTLYRAGQYGKAILRYTNLIDQLEKDVENQKVNLSLMYSNRAACYLKTGHSKAVMKDCQRSLDIIPHAIKPLLRRAAACEHLEKYGQAYVDYKHILSIDPSLPAAHSGASRCQDMLQQLDGPSWRDKLPQMRIAARWEVPEIILDISTAQPASAREFTSPPPEDLPNPDVEFEECKKLGNNHVQRNEFDQAVECYSKCVKLSPDNPVGFTNRALCYLKLNQPNEAVTDCNRALELDANNCKALYRRALARKALKQYKDSLQDLSEMLKLEPKNTAALKEFDVIKMSYKEELMHIKETTPPVEQGKKKARRIPIEEVEIETPPEAVQGSNLESKSTQKSPKAKQRDHSKTSETDSRKSSEEPQESSGAQKHEKNKTKGKTIEESSHDKTTADSKVAQKSSLSKKEEMKKIEEELEWLEPKQAEAQLSKSAKRRQKAKAKKLGVGEAQPEESENKDKCSTDSSDKSMKKAKSDKEQPNGANTTTGSKSNKKVKDSQRKPESEAAANAETDAKLKSSDQTSSTEGTTQSKSAKKKKGKQDKGASVTGLPQAATINPKKINATPYEFMTAWNSLKTCKESKPYSEILKQIPPKQLPEVISNKLEGPMLNMILKCVKQEFVSNGEHDLGYKILSHLSKVPRFSTVSMFLSSDDKKELSGVFTELSESSSTVYSQNDLDLLKKVYSIH